MSRSARVAPKRLGVRFVLGEEKPFGAFRPPTVAAEAEFLGDQGICATEGERRFGTVQFPPRPAIAKPKLRKNVQRGCFRAVIGDCQPYEDIVRVRLGIFDENVEVPVVLEYAKVKQLDLKSARTRARIFLTETLVGKLSLRVLIQGLGVGVSRRGVQVVIQLLNVLTMVALVIIESEQAFFQDRVASVP